MRKKLGALEEENRRLKEMVADLQHGQGTAERGVRKNGWSLAASGGCGAGDGRACARRRRYACKLLEVDRSTYRYEQRPDRNAQCVKRC